MVKKSKKIRLTMICHFIEYHLQVICRKTKDRLLFSKKDAVIIYYDLMYSDRVRELGIRLSVKCYGNNK